MPQLRPATAKQIKIKKKKKNHNNISWNKPKCPSKEEWIKEMWYIYIQWNITQPLKRMK